MTVETGRNPGEPVMPGQPAARQRGTGSTEESPPAMWPVPWSLVQGTLCGWGRVAEALGKETVLERSLEKPEDSEPHLCSPEGGNSAL